MKERDQGQSDTLAPTSRTGMARPPHEHLVQVAVGFGGETLWMERVTDEEYQGKKSP